MASSWSGGSPHRLALGLGSKPICDWTHRQNRCQMKRPCLDCGQIIAAGTRCRKCASIKDAARGSASDRGYGNTWRLLSAQILKRDGYQCAYCPARATTADHIIPKALGGTDHQENLVAACQPCNSGKRDRPASSIKRNK